MAPLQIDTEPRLRPHDRFLPPAGRFGRDPIVRTLRTLSADASLKHPRPIRVALAGCGVVGGGFVRLLHETAPSLASRFGVRIDLTSVLVRDIDRDRNLPIERSLLTNDLDEFLSRESDVIIEAVGGDEPARSIAAHALSRGKKFITANKDLVASHGIALSALAEENRVGLDFGAAVGGSAPVISTLRDLLGACTPLSIRGILNGTSNYVISEIERGTTLEAALEAARCGGLAESDCSRDLDGRDAAAKLGIIAWIAFGIRPSALDLRRIALPANLERLVRCASTAGGRLRLIAECTRLPDGTVSASVEPTVVEANSGFGRTTLEENRVEVDLGWGTPLAVSGPGAGSRPTATALLGDLLGVSQPRNERGAGATSFIPVPDERHHHWLVSARIPRLQLQALTAAAGVGIGRTLSGDPVTAVVTRRAPWLEVRQLLSTLDTLGAEPSIARYALSPAAEEGAR